MILENVIRLPGAVSTYTNQLFQSNRTKIPIFNTATRYLLLFTFALTLFYPQLSKADSHVETGNNSSVSSFWSSVAQSAGKQVGGVVAGYALTSLGLSGPNQKLADLNEIVDLLSALDIELNELVNEVQALECLTAQDQTTLTNSIKNIQGLYDTYSDWVNGSPTVPCWEESDQAGNVCFGQTGIKTWLNEVIDPENGVNADLDAINDVMIQAGNTGVIYTCVKTITDNYNSSTGPKKIIFDWTGDSSNPGYYDQVQSLTNYYYGIQAQAAALLSEASHLQACLSLGLNECAFTGQSSESTGFPMGLGADPSNPGDICANAEAGSQAEEDCEDAQNSVTKAYTNIKAQLIQAGAPYTNDLLGRNWNTQVIYTKSLENFTNKATANGNSLSDCPTPLSSASPCGFTVGAYNLNFPNSNKIDYAGYSFWNDPSGSDLDALLSTYNNETSGNTSSTLGAWMNSVGFKNAENKIVLTRQTGSAWGTNTVCFMDTSIARSNSKQPWCDGHGQGTGALAHQTKSGGCGGPCYFADYEQVGFTGTSIRSDFYLMSVTYYNDYGITYDWNTKPGWLAEEQGNSKFHHFHWGAFSISNLPTCTVRTPGEKAIDSLNPGGIYSMCGADLQAWLDARLQEPQVPAETLAITVSPDLKIRLHSTIWQAPEGPLNIWAYFHPVGADRNGKFVWQLMRWGPEYGVPRLAPTYATVTPDLRLEIHSASYTTESDTIDVWANFFYSGSNSNGDHFWTLEEFGEN